MEIFLKKNDFFSTKIKRIVEKLVQLENETFVTKAAK